LKFKKICILLLIMMLSSVPLTAFAEPSSNSHEQKDKKKEDFFPIGVWVQSPSNAAGYKAMGINLFVSLWDPMSDQDLAYLKAAGMKTIVDYERNKKYINEDTIYAWMHGDEPDNAQSDGNGGWGPPVAPQKVIDDYNQLKQIDPSRPVYLNLGQGVAWPEYYGRGVDAGRTDVYYEYAKAGDILSYDIYPVNNTDSTTSNKLWMVPQGVDNLKKYSNHEKPVWAFIETTNISGVPGHSPTPDQVKSEVWMALVHGANGIEYFCHIFAPQFDEAGPLHDDVMRPAITAINKQIQKLAPVLNSPTIENGAAVSSSNAQVPIDIMVKQYKKATYIFSVAMRDGSTTGTFTVPSGSTVEVIGENRSLPVADGKFTDDFASFGVHLYKVTAKKFKDKDAQD
jgi:hypothetical protein